jgi:hypothetical protein
VDKVPRFAGSSRAGDGKQVRAQPRNETPAAEFRSRDVERAETAAATLVVAGLTGINAYESTDPDNAFSDGLTPTGVFR